MLVLVINTPGSHAYDKMVTSLHQALRPLHPQWHASTASHSSLEFHISSKLKRVRDTTLPHYPSPREDTPITKDTPPLRWNPDSITYTDGSCLSMGDFGNVCGAAVYFGPTNTTLTVKPTGQGVAKTINGAELAAIWAALDKHSSATNPHPYPQ